MLLKILDRSEAPFAAIAVDRCRHLKMKWRGRGKVVGLIALDAILWQLKFLVCLLLSRYDYCWNTSHLWMVLIGWRMNWCPMHMPIPTYTLAKRSLLHVKCVLFSTRVKIRFSKVWFTHSTSLMVHLLKVYAKTLLLMTVSEICLLVLIATSSELTLSPFGLGS